VARQVKRKRVYVPVKRKIKMEKETSGNAQKILSDGGLAI
jgi:hypothetical protein